MDFKFQNYEPSTRTFKPSQAKRSHNRVLEIKKPGGTIPKVLLRLSPEMSEQGVEFSDESLPSVRLQATAGLIDVTRSDTLPRERGTYPPNPGEPNYEDQHNVLDGGHDRPSVLTPPPCIITSQQLGGSRIGISSTSDVRRSSLTVSRTDDRPTNNYTLHDAIPPAILNGTSRDPTNGGLSVSSTDPLEHDALHLNPQSGQRKTVQNILPIQAEVTVTSSAMVRKSKATVPAPILVENDVNPSADKADKDEVMADMDDINDHGHGPVRGPSTGLEQDQRADLAADEEWEITELIGKEVIHGKVHYLVRWKATLVPEHEINAPDLIGEFEARFGAKAHTSAGSGRIAKKTRPKVMMDDKETNTRRRGRPRKGNT